MSENEWKPEDEVVITFGTLQQVQTDAFKDGVRYALQYLEEVYGDGITETDLWKEFIGTEDSEAEDDN